MVVGRNAGIGAADLSRRMHTVLERLGIDRYCDRYPHQLSGGQRQRVAIARAIIHGPNVILADEPSGNLDTENKQELHRLFIRLRERFKKTLVIVTHDRELAGMADRIITMKDGRVEQ